MFRRRSHLVLALLLTTACLSLFMVSVGYAASPQQEAPDTQPDGQEYVVQAGDYLSKISLEFLGSSSAYPRIVDATNAKAESDPRFAPITNPSLIRVGQLLWIPVAPEEPAAMDEGMDDAAMDDSMAMTPSVYFVAPQDGASVPLVFDVEMAAEGVTIEPAGEIREGAGHFHILVDTDFVAPGELVPFDDQRRHFGQGQLTTTLELEPGVHTLRLQVANGAHQALDGSRYGDTITVTVEPAMAPNVHFVAPEDGATVPPVFDVEMAAEGFTVEPAGEIREGAGHFHILVDTDFVAAGELVPFDEQHLHFGQGQLTTTLELEPGEHVLRLQAANGAHQALDGEGYRDTITVTVEPAMAPNVHFVVPEDGAIVPPVFEVEMAAEGFTVEPAGEIREGAGHFHILVDTDFVAAGELVPFDEQHLHFGQGQLTTTLTLEGGVHTLRLQAANGAHQALDGEEYQDAVTVTVEGAMAPSVRFVAPEDGATVPPVFDVEMAAEGFTVEPAGEIREGAGHFHILVDTDFVAPGELIPFDEQHLHFGQGQLTTTLELEPGVHTLRLQAANGAHQALDGEEYQDSITVTVEGG